MPNRLDGKGSARRVKVAKRQEAEARNAKSAPDSRRSFWRERGFERKSHARRVIFRDGQRDQLAS